MCVWGGGGVREGRGLGEGGNQPGEEKELEEETKGGASHPPLCKGGAGKGRGVGQREITNTITNQKTAKPSIYSFTSFCSVK